MGRHITSTNPNFISPIYRGLQKYLFIGENRVSRIRATMGLRSFLNSCTRLLKLAKKPGREELWLSIRICLLGIVAVGAIGFIIKLISGVLQGFV